MQKYGIKRKLIWRSGLCPWERCLFFPSMYILSQKLWSTKKSLLKAMFPIIHLHNTFLPLPHSRHSWTVCPQLSRVPIWCQQFLSQKSWYWDLFFNLLSLKYPSSYNLFQSQTLPWFRHIAVLAVSAYSLHLLPALSLCLPSCCSLYARCSCWTTFRLLLCTCLFRLFHPRKLKGQEGVRESSRPASPAASALHSPSVHSALFGFLMSF